MALAFKDRVADTSETTGTGTLTLVGAAPTGFRTFAAAHATGDTVRYAITSMDQSEWEVGEGVWTSSGNTLSRATVYASSNSNALVSFSAGVKNVAAVAVAADVERPGSGYAQLLTGTAQTLTGTFADLLTASITTVRTGSRVVLKMSVGAVKSGSTGSVYAQILWNGSVVALQCTSLNSGFAQELSLLAVVTGVAAGTHTAKVQVKYDTSGGTVGGDAHAACLLVDEQFV